MVQEKKKRARKKKIVKTKTPQLSFKERLSLISQTVAILPVSGQAKDGSYWYDKASEVFPIFNALFAKHRILPPRLIREDKQIVEFGPYPAYELSCTYVLEDIDSPESITMLGSGLCFNRDWSLDAAHTWTLKRALKDFFLAGCPQPEGEHTADEASMFADVNLPYMQKTTTEIRQEADAVFGKEAKPVAVSEPTEAKSEITPEPEPAASEPTEKEDKVIRLYGSAPMGKHQRDRVVAILDHFKKIYEMVKKPEAYNEVAIKNAIWTYCENSRWPKSDEEAEEIKLNIQI